MKNLLSMLLLLGAFAGCIPTRAQQPDVDTYPGTHTVVLPGFDFKAFYDSAEVFQKQGIYYSTLLF